MTGNIKEELMHIRIGPAIFAVVGTTVLVIVALWLLNG